MTSSAGRVSTRSGATMRSRAARRPAGVPAASTPLAATRRPASCEGTAGRRPCGACTAGPGSEGAPGPAVALVQPSPAATAVCGVVRAPVAVLSSMRSP